MNNINLVREDNNNPENDAMFMYLDSTLNGNIVADDFNLNDPFAGNPFNKGYNFGKGGSHIWIKSKQDNNKRLGIIFYPAT